MLLADTLIKVFPDYCCWKPYIVIIIVVKNLINVSCREEKIKIKFHCCTISY